MTKDNLTRDLTPFIKNTAKHEKKHAILKATSGRGRKLELWVDAVHAYFRSEFYRLNVLVDKVNYSTFLSVPNNVT